MDGIGDASQTPSHLHTGQRGEQYAVRHLQRQGWEIVDRNFTTDLGEIDIIARRPVDRPAGTLIAFVEVKARTADHRVPPELSVTAKKRRTITRVARWYVQRHAAANTGYRFDVITVNFGAEPPKVQHFEGAFDALGNPY